MVVLSVKLGEGDGFLYETTTTTTNDELIASVVGVHNARLQGRAVAEAARNLAQHGPTTTPAEASSSSTTIRAVGDAPDAAAAETILRAARELEDYVDRRQVQNRVALTEVALRETYLANVRGAVIMMAYPAGLPEFDAVRSALDSPADVVKGLLRPEETTLWAAGKEFARGKSVSDRLGRNEKQKLIAKLQPVGAGPPGREPAVSEEERNAMMAHYFKRQEDLKKLSEQDDDDYLNSQWADPKGMKKDLHGLGSVKAPGLRF